jgi:hypothetical protein
LKTTRFAILVTLVAATLFLGGSFAQTVQAPSAIPSGSTTTGYGPYDLVNLGTALKTYKMLCFEAQPNSGPDTCLFRSYAGHLDIYNGSGTTSLGGLAANYGSYQGTTAVSITTTSYTALIAAASDVPLQANSVGVPGKHIHIRGSGVYTNAAASLLNGEVMLCTVSGCGSGTVVAYCPVTTTNQANDLTNGQFTFDCVLIATSTVGSSGTFMAKSTLGANLGTATTAALSYFADTATAAGSAVDETSTEYVNVAFKFSTSNAGNSATLQELAVGAN